MTTNLTAEVYDALREEVEAAVTEMRFQANLIQIEWSHRLGETIRNHAKGEKITPLLTRLAVDVGVSERTLWRAVQVYDLAPQENGYEKLIEQHGKNVSVKMLITPQKEEEKPRERCSECGRLR